MTQPLPRQHELALTSSENLSSPTIESQLVDLVARLIMQMYSTTTEKECSNEQDQR